jgi:peptidoglycan/xylan/chitin deacetylase (PgdA/CDA1 family)
MLKIKKAFKSFASRHQATILTYHGVIQSHALFRVPQHISLDLFNQHIEYLSNNFHCISLVELLSNIKQNKINSKSVVITFDDGFHNNYSNAFPILKRYNVPATIFAATGFIGSPTLIWPETLALILAHSDKQHTVIKNQRYLLDSEEGKSVAYRALTASFKNLTADEIDQTIALLLNEHNMTRESIYQSPYYDDLRMLNWPEIKELSDSGLVAIGSHTAEHRRLSRLQDKEAESEITQSKRLLEQNIGTIDFFAYPYGGNPGDYTDHHVSMVKDAGYLAAVSCAQGCVSTTSDCYQLPRASVGANYSVESLDYLLNGGNAFPDGFSIKSVMKGIVFGETG